MTKYEINKLKKILEPEIKAHMLEIADYYMESFKHTVKDTIDELAGDRLPTIYQSIEEKLLDPNKIPFELKDAEKIFQFFSDNFGISFHDKEKIVAATEILNLIFEFQYRISKESTTFK